MRTPACHECLGKNLHMVYCLLQHAYIGRFDVMHTMRVDCAYCRVSIVPAGAGDAGQEHEGGTVGAGWLCVVACQARQIGAAVLQAGILGPLLEHAVPPRPLLINYLYQSCTC